MVNVHRGEIEARLDGMPRCLVLTLGALASRFESGRLSSSDCIKIIACGLRGAGASVRDDEVSRMQADGGVTGFVDIVARLLTATFGGGAADGAAGAASGGGDETRNPFPGAT